MEIIDLTNPFTYLSKTIEDLFSKDNKKFFDEEEIKELEKEKEKLENIQKNYFDNMNLELEKLIIDSITNALKKFFISQIILNHNNEQDEKKQEINNKINQKKEKTLLKLKDLLTKWEDDHEFENIKLMFDNIKKFKNKINYETKQKERDSLSEIIQKNFKITEKEINKINEFNNKEIIIYLNNKKILKNLDLKIIDQLGIVEMLLSEKIDLFVKKLSLFFLNSTSFHDLAEEKDYHNLMTGIFFPFSGTYYRLISNKETGLGRVDHLIIPNTKFFDSAFIIEYKFEKNYKTEMALKRIAKIGLNQIDRQKYDSELINFPKVKKIIKICIAFSKKNIIHEWKEENNIIKETINSKNIFEDGNYLNNNTINKNNIIANAISFLLGVSSILLIMSEKIKKNKKNDKQEKNKKKQLFD